MRIIASATFVALLSATTVPALADQFDVFRTVIAVRGVGSSNVPTKK
jgi:hypothetical protein